MVDGVIIVYLWFALHATEVIVKKLHLTVGERGGGYLRRHCCRFELCPAFVSYEYGVRASIVGVRVD